ncbi:MAG: hypothetical protein JW912_00090 [Sedimentisphaerales bacterium]|nr:hypothetical protein [Sedimentisphaerales bacterium]
MKKSVKGVLDFIITLHPIKAVVLGYISYVLLGWILLCLPVTQSGSGANAIDNLFISASAVSTTGLVTVSISDKYTLLGEIVILALIQLGGIGYMTFGSFIILSRQKKISEARTDIGSVVFSLPQSFRIYKFVKSVIFFTVLIEAAGAAILYMLLRQAGQTNVLWSSIFHSVSAFCTAGFSLYNNSLESFAGNFWFNLTISTLSYLGAIGFIVLVDVWRRVTGRIQRITLTSKIILHATFWVSLAGTVIFFLFEPSVKLLPLEDRLIVSFFQAMTSMTTVGFNTVGISQISRATLLLLIMLMVIGASPSGTGGGLKSTTFSVLFGITKSTLKGENRVYFWGRPVPRQRVRLAVTTFCFYVSFLLLGIYFLTLTENFKDFKFESILFEAASALGTVGLSTGITPQLSSLGKIIIVSLMYIGRVGPLTFGMSLFLRPKTKYDEADNDVAI